MTKQDTEKQSKNLDAREQLPLQEDSFFLPDLCSATSVLVLVLVSELLSIVFVLVKEPLYPFNWQTLALISFFMQWVTLSSAAILCNLRGLLMRLKPEAAAFISFAIILVDTLVFSLISDWILNGPFQLDPNWWDHRGMQVLTHLIVATIIGGMVLRYFYVQAELSAKQRSELMHRIQALQSRIRPHFLFNSMNIIASLITIDPEQAEKAVEDLSQLFRASLNEVGNTVTLQQELDLCERYLGIETLRLGKRLQTDWQIDQSLLQQPIPLLTLQPLLENAVYHGIQHLPQGGMVRIEVQKMKNEIQLTVANDCLPEDLPSKHKGQQMALNNIRHRLQALFGDAARLSTQKQGDRFVSEIQIPLRSASND